MTSGLKVTILGSGSSGGVPRIGGKGGAGEWGACDPTEPRNRRRRCSILVERGATQILVDCSPDMRDQLIDARVGRLDAVFITHDHADQCHGLDDLRMVAQNMMRRVQVYTEENTFRTLTSRFGYCFKGHDSAAYPAILDGHVIERPFKPVVIDGKGGAIEVVPFDQDHGLMTSLGFRFGPIAYSSDVVGLDEAAFEALKGVDTWIVDALRYKPHPTHAHVDLALSWIERVKPRRAILTNLHIDLDYRTLASRLPAGVEPAFDGMQISA
ncbi:MAG: MBL fold metallo-hydrolase [Alphaproteobacteria bacterium]|nr:MBL fold metallo-hydrolase [Alphaproteobacteria bacterium]